MAVQGIEPLMSNIGIWLDPCIDHTSLVKQFWSGGYEADILPRRNSYSKWELDGFTHSVLATDSMEVKPIMTRKLRRRPNDPVPIPDKRRKPAPDIHLHLDLITFFSWRQPSPLLPPLYRVYMVTVLQKIVIFDGKAYVRYLSWDICYWSPQLLLLLVGKMYRKWLMGKYFVLGMKHFKIQRQLKSWCALVFPRVKQRLWYLSLCTSYTPFLTQRIADFLK